MKGSRDRKGKRKQLRTFNPEEERVILRIIANPDEIYRVALELGISVESLRRWVNIYKRQQQHQGDHGDEPEETEERRRKTSRPSNVGAEMEPGSSSSGKSRISTRPGPSASRAQLKLEIPTQPPSSSSLRMSYVPEPSVPSRQTRITEPGPSTSEETGTFHVPGHSTSRGTRVITEPEPSMSEGRRVITCPRHSTSEGTRGIHDPRPPLFQGIQEIRPTISLSGSIDTGSMDTESTERNLKASAETPAKVIEGVDLTQDKDDEEYGPENNNYAVASTNPFGAIPSPSIREGPKRPHTSPVLVCSPGPHLERQPEPQHEEELSELPESREHEETLPESPDYELPTLPESPEKEEELPASSVSSENDVELPPLPFESPEHEEESPESRKTEEFPPLPPESPEHKGGLSRLPADEELPPLPPESPDHEEELLELPPLPPESPEQSSASDIPMSIAEDTPPIEHTVKPSTDVAGTSCDPRYMLSTSGSYSATEPSHEPSDLSLAMETPMSLSEDTPPREISEGDSSSENKARRTADSGNDGDADSLAGIENIEDVSLPPPEFPKVKDSSSSSSEELGRPGPSKSRDPGVRTRKMEEIRKRRRSQLEDDDDDPECIGRKRPSFARELRKSLDDALGVLPYESDSSPAELDTPKRSSEESDSSSEEKDLRQKDKDDIGRNC